MQRDFQPSSLGLRRIRLLKGLSPERLERLARECAWQKCDARQRIISREAPDRDVYLLVSGRVRVTSYSANGHQVTFRDYGPGAYFGDVAALDRRPRSADVLALEDTLLARLSPGAFRALLLDEPGVAERVMRRLAGLVRRLSARIVELSTLTVRERLHAELLRLARSAGVANNAARISPAPKHAEIANRIGTYREQVSRELSALAKTGVLRREGRSIVVQDVGQLERFVDNVRTGA